MTTRVSPTLEASSAAVSLARLMSLTERYGREVERVHDVPKAEMRLLWLLSDGTPRSLKAISDALSLEQSTVNRQVGAAETRGHLRRFRADGEAALLVEGTDEGNEAFERAAAAHVGAINAGIDALGTDAETFERLFLRFVEGYGVAAHAVASEAS